MNPKEIEAVMLMGKSERIRDKPFIKINGKELFRYGYETLSRVFRDVLIVCTKDVGDRLEGYRFVVEDYGIGPMGAIYEGARNTTSEYIFVTGCDMPLLNEDVIRFICGKVKKEGVVPVYGDGKLEPLHSVYRREKILELDILKKDGRITGLIDEMDIKFIPVDEIKKYDPRLLTFRNINTKRDIADLVK